MNTHRIILLRDDSNHGHEHPVRELRVLLWDTLVGASLSKYMSKYSRYLDPYSVLFDGVSVSQ